MAIGMEFDNGLSKKGLQEVHVIVDLAKLEFAKQIESLKGEINLRFNKSDEINDKRYEESKTQRGMVFSSIESLKLSIQGLEFKHNWKTAFWVFIGSACPTTIAAIYFLMRMK